MLVRADDDASRARRQRRTLTVLAEDVSLDSLLDRAASR
jgi:hypothetical protein